LWQLSICAAAFWCNCHQIVHERSPICYRGSLRLEICVRITHGYGDCRNVPTIAGLSLYPRLDRAIAMRMYVAACAKKRRKFRPSCKPKKACL